MKPRNTAKLSSKFQLSIPKSVRDKHHWEAGQEFAFIPSNGSIMLVPVPTLEELVAVFDGSNTNNYRDEDDGI